MNKRINTHLALIIILLLSAAVTIYTLLGSRSVESDIDYSLKKKETAVMIPDKQAQNKNICQARAYEGKAEIKVWQVEKDGKNVLRVNKEDEAKMPKGNAGDFKLIDPTPELMDKIADSSEKNPVEIKISGYASLCDGTYLASLSYNDGIFRPYINK